MNCLSDIVHIDATGSIIRKPEACSKRIYYYAVVVKSAVNRRVCPVLEMVSCDHDATWFVACQIQIIRN